MYNNIEDYGVIGDLHTVALVGKNASIDFMSFPHFDSPTIFASLLDRRKGGRFQIAPTIKRVTPKHLSLPDTNVLLTRFLSDEGVAEVSDFMPVKEKGHAHRLVRRAKTVRGVIGYRMVCDPRFDYGRASCRIEIKDDGVLFVSEGPSKLSLFLHIHVPVKIRDGAAIAEFTLNRGETAFFILEEVHEDLCSPATHAGYVSTSFKETVNFWRRWLSGSSYRGRWRETVDRSALILKLLTSQTHGAIVAAPTFGLPEQIGGSPQLGLPVYLDS